MSVSGWLLLAWLSFMPGIAAVMGGRPYLLVALLPFYAYLTYAFLLGRRTMPRPVLWAFGLLVWFLAHGSAGGPLQTVPELNRISHGASAGLLAGLLCWELAVMLHAKHRIIGSMLLGFCGAVAVGAGMEVLEGVVDWQTYFTDQRFRDTIMDLVADTAGAAGGVLIASVCRLTGLRRRDACAPLLSQKS